MERLTRTDRSPFSPTYVQSIWRRLLAIEDILGDDYDLKRLKALVTGDTYTEEDMSAAYTAGFSTGMEQGEKKIERNNKALDMVPVVRCKDCTKWQRAKVNKQGFLICPTSGMAIKAEDYCSKGERGRRDD